ncbi:type IV pilus twitching motility protein PilT [Noviherbaspirillum galbum]|uniref:Flp pilus assembly complex ATPase component n=1 Tax=Noviherbaspirillum galbum TaxID=2709383 RepID=A0A6B3SR09_9BURK|nr:ATPase, T2SS/T4P/T4SS family [Noviherbaspirillum galbum]NEX63360.1 Flp pilus assembly complex ATPase component [Noviherbaspirillum galbum]
MSTLGQHILDLVAKEIVFTDLRIEERKPVMIRTPVGWKPTDYVPEHEDVTMLLNAMQKDWKARLAADSHVDFSTFLNNIRLRGHVCRVMGGNALCMVIRRLPDAAPKIEGIGLPIVVETFLRAPSGLILVTGPTSSGKTTTLAALLQRINEMRAAHIVTIEDPIEYVFEDKQSVFTQRELSTDVPTFSSGMEAAMRQCPDVILIGEIRDQDTAFAAVRAAESGRLVLASTHSQTTIGAVYKMLSFYGAEAQSKAASFAHSLVGIIAQALLPATDGESFVLASEVLNARDPQMQSYLSQYDQIKQAGNLLTTGKGTHCIPFNRSLQALVSARRIDESVAKGFSAMPVQFT